MNKLKIRAGIDWTIGDQHQPLVRMELPVVGAYDPIVVTARSCAGAFQELDKELDALAKRWNRTAKKVHRPRKVQRPWSK